MAASPLLCKPRDKQALEIRNQADVAEFLAEFVRSGRTRITEADVLALHYLTIKEISLRWKIKNVKQYSEAKAKRVVNVAKASASK